jgi:hypothetical protein
MKPGIAINPADFRLPWTPGNLNGSKDAAVNLANLADVAPKMSSVYTDSGNTVSQIYKQMLDGVAIPAQPANPAIEAQLAAADAVLFRNVDMIDDETGESVTRRIESQLYRDYLDNQNAYNAARMGYVGAYLEAQKTTTGKNTWPLLASTLQIPVRQAYDRWRAAGADKVEQAIAILNTSSQNALQKAFDNAKKTMEGYGVILEESGAGMAPTTYRGLLPALQLVQHQLHWLDQVRLGELLGEQQPELGLQVRAAARRASASASSASAAAAATPCRASRSARRPTACGSPSPTRW